MKLHIKNQLNNGLTIEFCCGDKEYTLGPDEEKTIEVHDEDCMYFDVVRSDEYFCCSLLGRIKKLEEQADFIRRRDIVYR